MAQRVAIALALAGEPDLLVADEPTSALDGAARDEVLAVFERLRDEGTAILFITHDWTAAARLCARTVVMYAGQIVEDAPTPVLLARPRHPYTEALLAARPRPEVTRGELAAIPGAAPRERPLHCRFADRCAYREDDCLEGPVPLVHGSRCLHSR
jgi:peptide/nickel transport system permease protein